MFNCISMVKVLLEIQAGGMHDEGRIGMFGANAALRLGAS
jgi:hypothetical protein